MLNFVREKVSGIKQRFKQDGHNLDLTYITNRIIAMAFPASGIEATFRNSIQDVSKLVKEKHQENYLIFNLSGRKYDCSLLGQNKIYNYNWLDHHAPPLLMLFEICQKMHEFLQQNINNVVIVHCLAGKGRTGTAICCYLIYSGRFHNPNQVFEYYSQKRFGKFSTKTGVTQPSQKRYVEYFHQILTSQSHEFYPKLYKIDQISLQSRMPPVFNSQNTCKPYVEAFKVNNINSVKIFSGKKGYSDQKSFDGKQNISTEVLLQFDILDPHDQQPQQKKNEDDDILISGDILLSFHNNGFLMNQKMFYLAFNTAFIYDNEIKFCINDLDPHGIENDSRFTKDFKVIIKLQSKCTCSFQTPVISKCKNCKIFQAQDHDDFNMIYLIIQNYEQPSLKQSKILLFGSEIDDDFDSILTQETKIYQSVSITKQLFPNHEDPFQIQQYIICQKTRLANSRLGAIVEAYNIKDKNVKYSCKIVPKVYLEQDPNKNHMFLKEISSMQKIKPHLNVLKLVDLIIDREEDKNMYMLMEYFNQGTLEDLLVANHYSEKQILGFFKQIVLGLQFIHNENGCIFGNISTRAIYVLQESPTSPITLKIGEFSFCLNKQDVISHFNDSQGHNQQNNQAECCFNKHSDIWQLGVLLYRMCFNTTNYHFESQEQHNNSKLGIDFTKNGICISIHLQEILCLMLHADDDSVNNKITFETLLGNEVLQENYECRMDQSPQLVSNFTIIDNYVNEEKEML